MIIRLNVLRKQESVLIVPGSVLLLSETRTLVKIKAILYEGRSSSRRGVRSIFCERENRVSNFKVTVNQDLNKGSSVRKKKRRAS